jgi:hypothetical protein
MERLNQTRELLPATPENKSDVSDTRPDDTAHIGCANIQFQSMLDIYELPDFCVE